MSNLLCRWQCQTKHSLEMVWTLHRDVPWRESLQNETRRNMSYLTHKGGGIRPTHPLPPPTERHISSLLSFSKHYVADMKLRARLHGSRKKFERSKTCKDPPFVYSGPAEFARFRVNGLHRQKNSSDEKFVRTRVNWISETREHLKYFWTEFFKAGLK